MDFDAAEGDRLVLTRLFQSGSWGPDVASVVANFGTTVDGHAAVRFDVNSVVVLHGITDLQDIFNRIDLIYT
jgi:hypothetical protein